MKKKTLQNLLINVILCWCTNRYCLRMAGVCKLLLLWRQNSNSANRQLFNRLHLGVSMHLKILTTVYT